MKEALTRGSGAGLDICILSRKNLQRITRIVRQARALIDAGHRVTVVCYGRPVDELSVTVPEVEWIEITINPWTRRRLVSMRRRRRERDARRAASKKHTTGPRGRLLSTGWWIQDAVSRWLQLLFVVPPAAVLLKLPRESVGARARELAALDPLQLHAAVLKPLTQRAGSLSFAEQAAAALKGRRFDVCQSHDNYALLATRRLAQQSGAQLIYDAVEISEHRLLTLSDTPRSLLHRFADRRERREEARVFTRHAAAMITIGDGLADWYSSHYPIPRPALVRNCRQYWPYSRRVDIRTDCGIGEGASLVVWFGYAYPEQGIEAIVEAAHHSRPDVHFALLADTIPRWTDFYAEVQRRAGEYGVGDRVHFLEAREPNELISYVSGADLGIIPRPNSGPNVYYSLPNKFMEMVMARLPVAVSELADMRQLVQQYGIGDVFDVTDPSSIATTVEAMLEPGAQSRMREALEDAARVLCWENEAQTYLRVVSEVASKMPDPPRRRSGHPETSPAPQPPAGPIEIDRLETARVDVGADRGDHVELGPWDTEGRMSATGDEADSETLANEASVSARVFVAGGAMLEVAETARVAIRRLEDAHEGSRMYASLTDGRGKAALLNPLSVMVVQAAPGQLPHAEERAANARLSFCDGSMLDVVQGALVVRDRLEQARAALGLFASLSNARGLLVYVNHATVAQIGALDG